MPHEIPETPVQRIRREEQEARLSELNSGLAIATLFNCKMKEVTALTRDPDVLKSVVGTAAQHKLLAMADEMVQISASSATGRDVFLNMQKMIVKIEEIIAELRASATGSSHVQ